MHDPSAVLSQVLPAVLAVVVALGALSFVIYWIRERLRENADPAESMHELLTEYREMNQQGDLTDEEYRIIKSRLVHQIGGTASPAGRPLPARDANGDEGEELGKDCGSGNG